jgi:hypothetical protein
MMNGAINNNERLAHSTRPVVRGGIEGVGVRSRWTPGVNLSIYEGEAGVGDAETAVLVDGCYVGGGADVEGVPADYGAVF